MRRYSLNESRDIEIEVMRGKRQGCTASTVLFKLITFKITEEIKKQDESVIITLGATNQSSSMQMMDYSEQRTKRKQKEVLKL